MQARFRRLGFVLGLLLCVPAGSAGAGPDDYESAPVRTAGQILGPDRVSGAGYTVREKVTSKGFLDHYEVESKFGLYKPGSDRLLKVRLREIVTMQRLLQMGGTNAYVKALEKKLVSLPTSLVQIAKNPVRAVENVPKAVTKTFGRVGGFLGGVGKKGKGGGLSPDEIRDGLVAGQKRRLAIELKVDVHSSNSKLQQMLEDVATARYAGEMTVSLASMAIPGGAGSAAYSTASYNTQVLSMLADKTDAELMQHNRQTLRGLGVHDFLVRKFLEAPHLSPRHQAVITTAMTSLRGVQGVDAIPQAALEAVDETRALLQEQQAIALAYYHTKRAPLARMHPIGGIVLAQTRAGGGVVMAPIDLAWYDAASRRLLDAIASAPLMRGSSSRTLHVKGRVTQRFVGAAKAAGIRVISGWLWLPEHMR